MYQDCLLCHPRQTYLYTTQIVFNCADFTSMSNYRTAATHHPAVKSQTSYEERHLMVNHHDIGKSRSSRHQHTHAYSQLSQIRQGTSSRCLPKSHCKIWYSIKRRPVSMFDTPFRPYLQGRPRWSCLPTKNDLHINTTFTTWRTIRKLGLVDRKHSPIMVA